MVNAVSVSSIDPFHRAYKANRTKVMMGEKIPRAFAMKNKQIV